MKVRTVYAAFERPPGRDASLLEPGLEHGIGHLVIRCGRPELRFDRVQGFRALERLAHHLE